MDSEKAKKDRKRNLRENTNPLSNLTFCYTIPTFYKGLRHDLDVADLPETLTDHQSAALGDRLEAVWNNEVEKAKAAGRTPSLMRVLRRVFFLRFLTYGIILAFGEFAIRLVQPLALGQLVSYYTSNPNDITRDEAFIYAAAVVMCSLLNIFFIHPYMMASVHLGMKMRVGCCSLIYRKALRLSKTALGQTTIGQVVNLLSNDVNRFDVAVLFANQLWIGPLETIVITYLMYLQVGISSVIGVASMLVVIPIQIYLGKRMSVLRLRTALRTDERVRLMNEIISGIQVIKMYTWEKPFTYLVSLSRRFEIKSVRGTSYIRGILLSFIMFSTRISVFLTVLAYVMFGHRISAEQVFVLTSFYGILRQNMTVFFPQGIGQIAEASVSIRRLNKFMLYEEKVAPDDDKKCQNGVDKKKNEATSGSDRKGIFASQLTAKWLLDHTDNTLSNVTLEVRPGKLLAVIGPVGSGKSSLLQAILKELPAISGSIDVCGEISYASQEPWLFAGSVRQNILFGLPMDKQRYRLVVKRCALDRDFELFPYGDKTIVGERGVSLSGGQRARINLARAVYKEADVYLLDDPLSAVDTHVGKHLFEACIAGYLKSKAVVLVTHQLQYLKEADQIIILENGNVMAQGTFDELQNSGLDFAKLLQKESENSENAEDTPTKKMVTRNDSIQSIASETQKEPEEVQEQQNTGTVGGYVFRQYFKNGGGYCFVFIVFLLFFLAQIAGSGGDYFITYWVNLEQIRYDSSNGTLDSLNTINNPYYIDLSTMTCIYIYTGISIATIIISIVRSFAFFEMCMKSSINLHDNMFKSITRATMYFFNTNPSGRILNRFSKDMGAIDELLPSALIDCLQIGLTLIGIVVVIGVVNPLLLIPTSIVGLVFYAIRIVYLNTGRAVKRLEAVTRSPVFSHLNASLQGLTTIRAFRAQKILEKEFDVHQDLHSSAWFLFLSTSRAFGFYLDIVCVIYIAIVTLSFLLLGTENFGGNVGLAITQAIALTGMFQWGMRQSTELENQMTSVERVLEYSNLESERELETKDSLKPRDDWPNKGAIVFDHVYLRYSPMEPHVLRNLNFSIAPKEKVGIVGRTGAGKSSLISALFQLTETEGIIAVDGVDVHGLGLHDLRSKLSIIPQEPVLFSGTMRKNLDPFDEYTDLVLWKALEDVELKDVVSDLPAGLNSIMSEGGTNFSVGQRQLVCLARAIIRNNKVLVLDEATANVDPHTDALIQTTIRKKFKDCTVLTIAHRLHTVMDSDKVLVMDAGTMVEFGHPHILLKNHNGFLFKMVEQTGKAMSETLGKIAEQYYNRHYLDTVAEEDNK
ncbi:probable multidrug resistance-associated protein lethal(2)03659 isoform X2 [Atheta coriaria]|uniref:probable multidrug resistance-associated protein lethal(2)03659 isoform X2 n=1 Tax=Dalotia coriaria TaxID=877792 RepID=UPI0031F384D4